MSAQAPALDVVDWCVAQWAVVTTWWESGAWMPWAGGALFVAGLLHATLTVADDTKHHSGSGGKKKRKKAKR